VTSEYLSTWQYGNEALALQAARQFIDFCKNRAWILTDTGATRTGVSLFQFTHRTFLEYFAAEYIKRSFSEDEISNLIVQRSTDPAWQMVCLILMQLIPQKRQGLEDVIVERLVREMPRLEPGARAVAISLCLRVMESMPLRPPTLEKITEKAFQQFFARLERAPFSPVASQRAVEGRESYWLDGERIAIENHRIVGRQVRTRLNEVMRRSEVRQRPLAHLMDYFVTQECRPSTLVAVLDPDNMRWLSETVRSKAWEAWIDAAALMTQDAAAVKKARPGLMLGNSRNNAISSIKTPWANRPLPNGMEIVAWAGVYCSDMDPSVLSDLAFRFGRPGLRQFESVSPKLVYEPHGIWHGMQDAAAGDAQLDPVVEAICVLSALCLLEHSLCHCSSDMQVREMVESYAAKPWGELTVVRAMVARRFGLSDQVSNERTRQRIHKLALDDWCQCNGPTAAALASKLL
jgi:hypothetical protein